MAKNKLHGASYLEFATPSMPLPRLPLFFGADSHDLSLGNGGTTSASSSTQTEKAAKIAELLGATDVSYLNLKDGYSKAGVSNLYQPPSLVAVNQDVPECLISPYSGATLQNVCSSVDRSLGQNSAEDNVKECNDTLAGASNVQSCKDGEVPKSKRKKKCSRKDCKGYEMTSDISKLEHGMVVGNLPQILKDFLNRKDVNEDTCGKNSLLIPLPQFKLLSEELLAAHSKKSLNLLPVADVLELLDHLNDCILSAKNKNDTDKEDVELGNDLKIMAALEAVQLLLTIMTHPNMPKQVYKEEVIENITEFIREQILHNVLASYGCLYQITESGYHTVYDAIQEGDTQNVAKQGKQKSCRAEHGRVKRSMSAKVSRAISSMVYKLCSILALLKNLLIIERLQDRILFRLIKTNMLIFHVEDIQLLQLKAITVICEVFRLYPEHRTFILEEVLELVLRIASRRSKKTYLLPGDDEKPVLMVIALVLQLVQCSAVLPEPTKDAREPAPCDCLEPALDFCKQFWAGVLHVSMSSQACEISMLKTVLENLTTDLLTTLNVPEFPAANLMLQVLCVMLCGENGIKSKDQTKHGIAIDLIGEIAARLRQDNLLFSQSSHWILQELHNNPSDVESGQERCVVCAKEKEIKTFIVCEGCQRCFHVDCVGACRDKLVSCGWSCCCCVCRRQLRSLESQMYQPQKNGSCTENFRAVTGVTIVKQIILNYLQDMFAKDSSASYACQFYLCQWHRDDSCSSEMLPFYHGRLNVKMDTINTGFTFSALERETIIIISATLLQQRSLGRGFDKMLERLLAGFSETSSMLRAKALKAVSAIVEVDPKVLCDMRVKSAVEEKFHDSSISVREAAIDLVGRHIAAHPDMIVQYVHKIAERINDKGVSVRKRVIKIIRDICLSKSTAVNTTELCCYVISRVIDEEKSIQDLVCKMFYELWFEEPSNTRVEFIGDSSFIPIEVAEKTQALVDLLSMLKNHQPLVTIVKRSLDLDFCLKNAAANPVSKAAIRNRFELMAKWLLESILRVEEKDSIECEVNALPFVLALHAFCSVDPTLCAPGYDPSSFLVTLQPYLRNQADNLAGSQLLQSIIYIITSILPLLRRTCHDLLEDLERDLRQLIFRCPFLSVVDACIKCLCCLCRISAKVITSFEFLLRRFFKHLLNMMHSFDSGNDNQMHVLRSLFCLGLCVRYGLEFIEKLNKKAFSMEQFISLCRHYYQSKDISLRTRALQALGFLCIAKPELMIEPEIRKITEASLSIDADFRIKIQILRNYHDYLIDVEDQLRLENTEKEGKENYAVPNASGEGDSNICVSIIQLHWKSILDKCLDMNSMVRQSALKVMEIVLRQGFVHPVSCVPYLITTEVDELETNSNLAHTLIIQMMEKYPSLFDSRIGDGIELSFQFIISGAFQSLDDSTPITNNGDCSRSLASLAKEGVSRVYKLFQKTRSSRNRFISTMIHKLDTGRLAKLSVNFLIYCTELLATLPFIYTDEPVHLVQIVNRTVHPRAENIEASLKQWIAEIQAGCTRMTGNGQVELRLEEQPTFQPVQHAIPDAFLQKSLEECSGAVICALLLNLKKYMKLVYGINDPRCQVTSSDDNFKSVEISVRQSVTFDITDVPVDVEVKTMDDILQHYWALKRSLEEESMGYTYSPTSTSKKRRAHTTGTKASPGTGKISPATRKFCDSNSPLGKRSTGRRLFSSPKTPKDSDTQESDDEPNLVRVSKRKRNC